MTPQNEVEVIANYYFLPHLREGLSSLITKNADDPGSHRATVAIQLQAIGNGDSVETKPIGPPQGAQLFGPGDVIGFNESAITRCEPKRNVGDFEPNYFPFIEFEQPDFPWRFTATSTPEDGHLMPWMTLIVLVAEGEDKEFTEGCGAPNPKAPCITVEEAIVLPDLLESWRWAHVQVTTDGTLDQNTRATKLADIIRDEPDRVVSRLLCARRLRPRTLYRAFVVPTFELGRLAGLGLPLDATCSGLDLAWDSSSNSSVELPYYYMWEFRTGAGGDFEELVRRLEYRKLRELGKRDVDCARVGYGLSGATRTDEEGNELHTLGLEGALKSLDTEPMQWGYDVPNWSASGPRDQFQVELANLINQPSEGLEHGNENPVVAPPIYGRWHAAAKKVEAAQSSWVHELNLDPRHRMAAAFGTQVVQRQQEELMASAWDQLGAIDEANEILRRAQFGRETSISIHEHRLKPLPSASLIRVAAAVHAKVLMRPDTEVEREPETVRHCFQKSPIPLAALDPVLRRIARPRGPLRKRQHPRSKYNPKDMLERLNDGSLRAAGAWPRADGALRVCDITYTLFEKAGLANVMSKVCPPEMRDREKVVARLNLFCEQNLSCGTFSAIPGRPDFTGDPESPVGKASVEGKDSEAATRFRKLLMAVCKQIGPQETKPAPAPIDLDKVRDTLLAATDPRITVAARIRKRLHLIDVPEQKDPLDQIMSAPVFDAPMYRPLAEISQDLVLPGLETVPQNTLGLLKTNGRFVESHMVGLNHEMARELLWREYPTDQRCSCFRQFWDVHNYMPVDGELDSLLEDYLSQRGMHLVDDLPSDEKELILKRHNQDEKKMSSLSPTEIADKIQALLKEDLLDEKLRDILPIHEWHKNRLGTNDNRPIAGPLGEENLVLLIRGDLLLKYPNTRIYAVKGEPLPDGNRVPGLPEFLPAGKEPTETRDPMFSGQLPPDVTFLGFNLTAAEVKANPGWYFVIEERVSEARFGFDAADRPASKQPGNPNEISWGHIKDDKGEMLEENVYLNDVAPELPITMASADWHESAAVVAEITLQQPVRISVHASKMIP